MRVSGVFRRIGKDSDGLRGLWDLGRACQAGDSFSRSRVWNEQGELGARRTTLARDGEMDLGSDSVLRPEW